ncbi:protein kinase [Kitasatospora sp. NPDC096147]|uniref:serine/threonine-protein kinase n=1 Tax=Kitasatospora sp. NPDC096147 TaxID=3364093 RepID=UPI0037F47FBC
MTTGGPGGQLVDGRFELLERLGGGGMGLVWRARDTVLQREVALKEVRPPDPAMLAADPAAAYELRERVLREAQALARLQHPNVVIIYHIVDTPELPHPWLVMELVTGGSLHDRIGRGRLSPPEAARIGRGVLSALRAAHAAGIQHRDVKPGNVLMRTDGTPVLTDFGIAALSGSTSLTATGSLIGSPEFIAPERIRGQEGNPSSDLWSLGMMLYVAVEGHHPLRRATSLATLAAVLDEPLPPPVQAGPLGPTLTALLARDPAVRPDAAELDRLFAAAEQGIDGTMGGVQQWPTQVSGPIPYTQARFDSPYAAPSGHPSGHPGQWGPYGPDAPQTPNGAREQHSGPTGWPTGPSAGQGGWPSGATDRPSGQTPWPSAGPGGSGPQDRVPGQSDSGPQAWKQPEPAERRPARPRRAGPLVAAAVAGVLTTGLLGWALTHGWFKAGGGTERTAGKGTNSAQQNPGSVSGSGAKTVTPGSTASGSTSVGDTPSSPAASTGATKAPPAADPGLDLLTPAGALALVTSIQAATGSTVITDMTVYPEHASAKVVSKDNPKRYEDVTYRAGKATVKPGGAVTGNKGTADLTKINWNQLPTNLATTQTQLGVEKPESRYIIVDYGWFAEEITIRYYVSDDYSGGGYLTAGASGKVLKVVKP